MEGRDEAGARALLVLPGKEKNNKIYHIMFILMRYTTLNIVNMQVSKAQIMFCFLLVSVNAHHNVIACYIDQ